MLGDRPPHALQALRHQRPVGLDVRAHVGERAAVAGQGQPRVERVDAVQRAEELADRVGRPAVVEEQRHAAEQVVAGDEHAVLGLVQADVRGRVAGRLDDGPRAEVGVDDDAVDELAVGLDEAGDPAAALARRIGPLAQRLERHAALAGDLEAARQPRLGVLDARAHVGVGGVHPQLAAAGVDDARGLPVVVGVRVRADEQPHVAQARSRPGPARARARPASRARAARSRTARRRRRRRSRRRWRAGCRATAAAGAGARRPARRARRDRARGAGSWSSWAGRYGR